jgi:alanyl-tRNA synthetase
MRNHSVTHLMHKALREVLGATCSKGLAGADKTRFDFAHNAPVTPRDPEIERASTPRSWPTAPPRRA